MPHITLADNVKLGMMNYLSKNRKITLQYRSVDMMDYPALPQTRDLIWSVKTVAYVNRPRFVVIGFQTDRSKVHHVNSTLFDPCDITELRLHMNTQIFPYNMNEIDITGGLYAELYDMYAKIQSTYYNGVEPSNPFGMGFGSFQHRPLFVFDTSRTDELLINSSVDIKVEIKAPEIIPARTAAYCLIVYDNEFTYQPFEGIVVRSI